jgi:hypothetical protein
MSMPNKQPHYYISYKGLGEKEVTLEEFIRAEQQHGFHSKFGKDHPATGGFSSGDFSGTVQYLEQAK